MRLLDRYVVRQLAPAWLWCVVLFLTLSSLVDLFGRLDDILRFHIPAATVLQFYLYFLPVAYVKASPLALLLASAFVATRLSRYQELLAMNASGTSLLRAALPFLFIGWLASLTVFAVNDLLAPRATVEYERMREEVFRGRGKDAPVENVAILDEENRIYHARALHLEDGELLDLTVLEHDAQNRPTKSLYASRAVWTPHGWLLLYGTIYRVGPKGELLGAPQQYVERLMRYPVSVQSFAEPTARPETMRYAKLRRLISRLRQTGITNVRRYAAELAAKLTMPLMNLVMCLLAFVGSAQPQLRGNLRGLGLSLGWGLTYFVLVAICQGIAKEWRIPTVATVWAPHILTVWWCLRRLSSAQPS